MIMIILINVPGVALELAQCHPPANLLISNQITRIVINNNVTVKVVYSLSSLLNVSLSNI